MSLPSPFKCVNMLMSVADRQATTPDSTFRGRCPVGRYGGRRFLSGQHCVRPAQSRDGPTQPSYQRSRHRQWSAQPRHRRGRSRLRRAQPRLRGRLWRFGTSQPGHRSCIGDGASSQSGDRRGRRCLRGAQPGSTGSSQAGLVSGLLGGLNLGTVGSTVNNLPLVGPITTNLQSAQPETALIQNVAPTGLSQTQGSVGIEDVPTLEAALGGGKYLTSAGTVVSFPQEAQGMVAGASAGVQGQLSGVTSQLGDVSSQLGGFGQASQLGGATAQLGSVASQLGGLTSSLGGITNVGEDLEQVARYIQIGGQTVALNSAGQILGLVQNPAQTQNPAVSALEQNPAINYFQSPTDGATSASPASDDGDAMDLVAQAMTGGEQAAGGNGFDDASWKMGGEMEDQRLTTATMSMTGAWSIPPVTASSTEAWIPATTTAEADGEGWGGWVSATALTKGAWSSAATGTASVTSSTMMPTGSAGLS